MANKSKLFGKIQNAKVIIGESSGAMIFGEEAINDTKSGFVNMLGLIEKTVVRPHYNKIYENQEELRNLYVQEKAKTNYDILGIDETTFVEYENGKYGEVIGKGGVYQV